MVRDVAFGLEIGVNKLWTAIHTFTIEDEVAASTGADPTTVTVRLITHFFGL